MKKLIRILPLLLLLPLGGLSWAHEGHHPSQDVPPNGGILKDNQDLQLELVKVGEDIRLYAHSLDLKSVIPPSELQVQAAEVFGTQKKDGSSGPQKKGDLYANTKAKFKSVTSKLLPQADHFRVTIDRDGSYRYLLFVKIKYKGKTQHLSDWAIQP